MAIELPYRPRKYDCDWLETLRHDSDYWSPEDRAYLACQDKDYYPSEDGRPMAESDVHGLAIRTTIETLQRHFEERPEIYISGNNFVYWEQGNNKAVVSPDVYVVIGAGMRLRDSYKIWEEHHLTPDFVIEFTSPSSRYDDFEKKQKIYEQVLGIQEYFLCDPRYEYLPQPLMGFRLINGKYTPISPEESGRLFSDALGLELALKDIELRFFDPKKQTWLLTPREQAVRADTEAVARQEAEAEVTRLRAELEALRKQNES